MSFFLTLAPTAGEADDPNAPAGGIAIVQSASDTTANGGAGLTVNFGVPVTAGNSVIALMSFDDSTDVGTNSPTLVGGVDVFTANVEVGLVTSTYAGIFSALNRGGGETGVNVVVGGAVRASMQILEVSGLADAAAFATNTDSGTANTLHTGTFDNTGHITSLIIGIIASDYADMTAMGASLTPVGGVVGGASVYQTVGYFITSTEEAAIEGTSVGSSSNFAGAIAGFDPA